MFINMKCKVCFIDLTTENARKRKGVPSGYRPLCKSCRNAYERPLSRGRIRWDKRAPLVPCGYCKSPCKKRGKLIACSLKCRLLQYIKICPLSGCWIWQGTIKRDGYGTLDVDYKIKRAHRLSYEIFKGPIPENMFVCHSCDNPPCVNPEHLWIGDNQDNQIDSVLKKRNRYAKQDR